MGLHSQWEAAKSLILQTLDALIGPACKSPSLALGCFEHAERLKPPFSLSLTRCAFHLKRGFARRHG